MVVLRSPIHANEPSEYSGILYRTSNRVLNNGTKVIILICMDGTSQYHHHQKFKPRASVKGVDGMLYTRSIAGTVDSYSFKTFLCDDDTVLNICLCDDVSVQRQECFAAAPSI